MLEQIAFTFKANDRKVDSSNAGRITIHIIDHPPVAQNGAVTTFGPDANKEYIVPFNIGIKLNATDADADDTLTYSADTKSTKEVYNRRPCNR